MKKRSICACCDGSGAVRCAKCGGLGLGVKDPSDPCRFCNGEGALPCGPCEGTGIVESD